jgi:hypothetical protein
MKLFSRSFNDTIEKIVLVLAILNLSLITMAQKNNKLPPGAVEVGVVRIDISPYGSICISGYLSMEIRINESEGVLEPLWAKAMRQN